MKKLLLLLIFNLQLSIPLYCGINYTFSQEWFPQGAKWHYNWRYNLPIPPYIIYYPEVVEVVKDTVVLGKNCRKIVSQPTQHGAFSQEVSYVFDSLGMVYYYPPLGINSTNLLVDDKWSILYDFNKSAGDTIFYNIKEIRNNGLDTFTYYNVIDTTFFQSVNGNLLRGYNSTPSEDFWPFQLYFATNPIEVIGDYSPIVFGGHWSYVSFTINPSGFRCYEDTIIGLYKNPGWKFDCDSVWSQETSLASKIEETVRVYPIPSNDKLNLELKNRSLNSLNFNIFDLQGNLQKQIEITDEFQSLDVSNLEPGMYIYQFEAKGETYRNKLLIE